MSQNDARPRGRPRSFDERVRAGKGDPGILVEGLRRSDDRRSRRRDGRGTAEPVFRLRRQADVVLARP